MVIATPRIARMQEIKRLQLLIPNQLQDLVTIEPSRDVQHKLIHTRKIRRCCLIQIDLLQWQSLDRGWQNLLFWHEIAKIQNGSIESDRSEYISIAAGLGIAWIDMFAQNIGLLTASLLVAGWASFRLYQKHLGEKNLQRLTVADRDAIELAVQFGYDRSTAGQLLATAIKEVAKQTQHKSIRDRYATRLQVLSLY
jgi:hypothetical protein